jgi:hypothetical protein
MLVWMQALRGNFVRLDCRLTIAKNATAEGGLWVEIRAQKRECSACCELVVVCLVALASAS